MKLAKFQYPDQNQRLLKTHIIHYPDGCSRVLTMPAFKWAWIDEAERHGYALWDILGTALQLSEGFPSEKGSNHDIATNTAFMLRVIHNSIHEETHVPRNDFFSG